VDAPTKLASMAIQLALLVVSLELVGIAERALICVARERVSGGCRLRRSGARASSNPLSESAWEWVDE